MTDVWYRYEEQRYAPSLDEYDRPMGRGTIQLHLREYAVIKTTPKGVWLESQQYRFTRGVISDRRFVLREARKRFACPTKEEALVSFLARKNRQLRILKSQIRDVEDAILLAKGESNSEYWIGPPSVNLFPNPTC
jgi:hypothetical protein